jgi:hypothetical protein
MLTSVKILWRWFPELKFIEHEDFLNQAVKFFGGEWSWLRVEVV